MERAMEQFKKYFLLFLLKKRFCRMCRITEKFKCQGKQLFLSEFEKNFSAVDFGNIRQHHRHVLRYSLLSVFSFLLVSASAFVYADQANIGPDQPLYKLKILGETIQLTVSPPNQKAELNYKFAQRRLEEIKDLELKQQNDAAKEQEKINQLSDDFDDHINKALDADSKVENSVQGKSKLCDSISQTIDEYNKTSVSKKEDKKNLPGFQKNCVESEKEKPNSFDTDKDN
jgi:hypothetical protein